MNTMMKRMTVGTGAVVLSALLATVNAFAQTDSTASSTSTATTTTTWYTQWWLWAIGVAIFLIVVIALTNRGGNKNS